MNPHDKTTPRFVVAGAQGRVGRLIANVMAQSRMLSATADLPADDIRRPGPGLSDVLRNSDGVVMCVPQDVAIDAAPSVMQLIRPGALWVDTCSVKTGMCRALAGWSRTHEILSINPMGAPELGLRKQNVAVVRIHPGPLAERFLGCLSDDGAVLFDVSADEHDRRTAAIQVASHAALLAFGIALERLGYDASAAKHMWTPPHEILLMLLARMTTAGGDVYLEIQRDHPHAEAARTELIRAMEALSRAAQEDLPAWNALMLRLRAMLGTEEGDLAARCAALAAHLRTAL